MWTSAVQGEGSPATFYERYGFKRTGDSHGNEILLRLEISQHQRGRRATSGQLQRQAALAWASVSPPN
ncbi:MAG: hypothetical protein WKF41_10525 [Gaiellaceae bacterium]